MALARRRPRATGSTASRLPRSGRPDLAYTGVGFATNHAAPVFWAAFFEGWHPWRGRSSTAATVRGALAVSAVAAAVDYGTAPKRFTPGWEFVLSKRATALTYGAMPVGLAAGALLWQKRGVDYR